MVVPEMRKIQSKLFLMSSLFTRTADLKYEIGFVDIKRSYANSSSIV